MDKNMDFGSFPCFRIAKSQKNMDKKLNHENWIKLGAINPFSAFAKIICPNMSHIYGNLLLTTHTFPYFAVEFW